MLKNILLCTALIFSVSATNVMADNTQSENANTKHNKPYEKNSVEAACKDNANSEECRKAVKEEKLKKSLKVKEEPTDGGMDLKDE
jgi:hypothetical protein